LEFAVLGPLEVRDDGDLVDVGPRMPRALLASLLIEANRVVSQDRLIDQLWGDDSPAQATAALQVYVSNLRRALERDREAGKRPRMLLTRAPGYVLQVPAEALDATRFEALVAEGRSRLAGGNPTAAREVFRRALGLWRGEPYADLAAEAFVAPEAARLSELRAGAVEALMEAELALGGHSSVVAELERLVSEEPLRERRWELLALALYRCGRQAEALRAIAKARSTLAEELGLDPGASLRNLENDILQQSASLDWTSPVEEVGQVAWEPPGPTVSLPALLTRGGQFSFVGRAQELERLERAWKEVVGGQRRVILVGGEVGVGKTRLAAELARRLHPEGALVLAGRCDEDMGVPFQPFVEALRHFVAEDPEPARRLGRNAGELTRLVPELVERVPHLHEPLRSDPETERYRLFEALAAWLAAASSDQPVLLVLDDLHWAARPTLLVLRHIVRSPAPMRLLVLGTYRDTEMGAVLPEFLADLRRDPEVERLSLSGLDAPEVQAFLEAAGYTVSGQDPALSRAIWAETDGNPFFVGEMLRYLAESGALTKQDGRWVSTMALEDLGIPEGVKEVLGRRLSRLSEAANRALRIAAVAGVEFELVVLEAVAGLDEETLLGALDEGLVARLLFEVPGPTPRYRFAHALVRGILYDQVAVGRRVGLHRRVGEAIETLQGHDIDDHLPALAHHFAAGGDMAKAVLFATRAGERALAHLAYDEAVAYYGQALEVLEVADLPDGEDRHLVLLIALGEAQRRAGDPSHRETLLHAARLAQARGDADVLSRAALANRRGFIFSAVGTEDPDRVAVLEAAIDAIAPDSPTRARLLATLGLELVYGGDPERCLRLSDDALALARRLGDRAALADVLLNRYYTIGGPDTRDERLANAAELLVLAEHLGDPVLTAQALFLRLFAALEDGEVGEAHRALDACEHLAGELGQPTLRWFATFWRGAMALLAGRLEEADRHITAAFELGQASGQPDAVPFFVAQQYWIRFEQGRLNEVEAALTELVHRLPWFVIPRTRLALLYCELDRPEEARVLYDELVGDGLARLPKDWSWLVTATACAAVCAYLGDTARASVLYHALAPYEGRFPTPAAVAYRSVSHHLGLLATTLGRFDEAERHFSTAAAMHERIGAPAWLARTRLEWARLLGTRGRTGDAERAVELLGQARATARELGLGRIERRAAALLP
jgi:DNA-binding SARP family transcriptional activator